MPDVSRRAESFLFALLLMSRPKGETPLSIKGETAHKMHGNKRVQCRFGDGLLWKEGWFWEGVGLCGHVCVCKYVAPWERPATSHHPPLRRIRPSAHLSHQSHREDTHTSEQYGEALWTVFDLPFIRLLSHSAGLLLYCPQPRLKSPLTGPKHASQDTSR